MKSKQTPTIVVMQTFTHAIVFTSKPCFGIRRIYCIKLKLACKDNSRRKNSSAFYAATIKKKAFSAALLQIFTFFQPRNCSCFDCEDGFCLKENCSCATDHDGKRWCITTGDLIYFYLLVFSMLYQEWIVGYINNYRYKQWRKILQNSSSYNLRCRRLNSVRVFKI